MSRQIGRGTFRSRGPQFGRLAPGAARTSTRRFPMQLYQTRRLSHPGGECRPPTALTILANDWGCYWCSATWTHRRPRTARRSIRAVRSRHPQLPIAAIVAALDDLQALFGTAEWPLHTLPKPIDPWATRRPAAISRASATTGREWSSGPIRATLERAEHTVLPEVRRTADSCRRRRGSRRPCGSARC